MARQKWYRLDVLFVSGSVHSVDKILIPPSVHAMPETRNNHLRQKTTSRTEREISCQTIHLLELIGHQKPDTICWLNLGRVLISERAAVVTRGLKLISL